MGLFEFRRRLVLLGMAGIQCINGSFCEEIERTEGRAPGDIDVVTFHDRPPAHAAQAQWDALIAAHPSVFETHLIKAQYSCDAYFVDVSFGPGLVISQTAYWVNLFTHKRVTYEWKGALMMQLGPAGYDDDAIDFLVNHWVGP